jgi:hypothetical protein
MNNMNEKEAHKQVWAEARDNLQSGYFENNGIITVGDFYDWFKKRLKEVAETPQPEQAENEQRGKLSPEGFCYDCQESDGNQLCDGKQYCDCPCHSETEQGRKIGDD